MRRARCGNAIAKGLQIPYERLNFLLGMTTCLQVGIDLDQLDAETHKGSNNEAAKMLNSERSDRFQNVRGGCHHVLSESPFTLVLGMEWTVRALKKRRNS